MQYLEQIDYVAEWETDLLPTCNGDVMLECLERRQTAEKNKIIRPLAMRFMYFISLCLHIKCIL